MTVWLLATYALPLILAALRWAWDRTHPTRPLIDFRIEYPRGKMEIGKPAKLTITPLDKDGNPTTNVPPGTAFAWASPDGAFGTFSLDTPDGFSATFLGTIPGLDNFTATTKISGADVTHSATVAYVAGPMADFRIDVSMSS